jgi:hypothetical protein
MFGWNGRRFGRTTQDRKKKIDFFGPGEFEIFLKFGLENFGLSLEAGTKIWTQSELDTTSPFITNCVNLVLNI